MKDTRIADLVDQNYVHAYVLYYFGIKFFDYSEQTLAQVCAECGLKIEQVVKELESPTHLQEADLPLVSYPVDLVIEYLKHSHFLFIKHKLPYIARLVEAFKANHPDFETIERDLKLVFPLFVEDFIEHIYEEEDTLFVYINALERALKGKYNQGKLFYLMEKNSIQKFAMEHEAHDDEMEGIRKITKDYELGSNGLLHIKVLYNELKAFEKSLITHARIENEILYPKAMVLENKVKQLFFEKVKFNWSFQPDIMGRVLAIDYGKKRTGIAVTDPLRIIATPLDTYPTNELLKILKAYLLKEQVDEFVIGMPKTLMNEDSETAPLVRKFVEELKKTFPDKPVHLADERFTSSMAKRAMIDGGMSKKDRQVKGNVDKISATIILQSFMDTIQR